MLVAAHNGDLAAHRPRSAQRRTGHGPHQKMDVRAEREWDVVSDSFPGVAEAMGC